MALRVKLIERKERTPEESERRLDNGMIAVVGVAALLSVTSIALSVAVYFGVDPISDAITTFNYLF
jgi:predicted transcriptional regulator